MPYYYFVLHLPFTTKCVNPQTIMYVFILLVDS